jgi:membrane protease subunit HflC
MNSRVISVVIAVAVVLGLALMSMFTVDQRELALVFQLGEIREVVQQPGLHFKWPLIQNVRYFDNRILTLDQGDADLFTTAERKNLLVDSFVKWRIRDPKLYYVSVGDEVRAQIRLAQTVKSALNSEIGKRTVHDVVSDARDKIMETVRDSVAADASKIGVDVVDVRLKRVELPEEVSESVYRRMDAERKSVASELRSQGFSDGEKIRAQADKEREIIIAEAYRDAQRVKGEGDSKAAAIYAQAFSANPEFYAFYRSLEAYRAGFKNKSDVLVVDPSSEFFRYFKGAGSDAGSGSRKGGK